MRKSKKNGVAFLHPLHARITAVDAAWNKACTVDLISNNMVEITADDLPPSLDEFYLILSSVGQPVYRRCVGASVRGSKLSARLTGELYRPATDETTPKYTAAQESLQQPSMAFKPAVRARRNTTYD